MRELKAKMTIRIGIDIHTIGARQTGNETYITNLIEAMVKAKPPDLEFVLYHTHEADIPDWPAKLRRVRPQNPIMRIPISFPLALLKDRIDVAHFQYVIPPISPCPTIATIHDISYEFYPKFFKPLSRLRMCTLIPMAARRSRYVLTVSQFSKNEIIKKYGIPEDKVIVTYNGVADRFRCITSKETLLKETARFKLNHPFILSVGTLNPRKNLPLLIKAYANLRKRGKIDQDLVLAGPESYKARQVFQEIKTQGVDKAVRAIGHVSDRELVALYNRADFFVYPSIYEGFGLPVVEAMACGTPVITSNCSSLPEVAGGAAVLIDPRSKSEMENAMSSLAADTDLRATLTKQGKKRAKHFTWDKTAEATLSAYFRALD